MTGDASRELAGTDARIPEFFIVGQSKSGTTALADMLREHPEIYMPRLKEPVFLASDLHHGLWAMVKTRPRTLQAYLALFAGAAPGQRVGEASTVYLWSRTAAANIVELQPRARVIAILREPASFLRSLHLQMLQSHIETEKDFGRAMSLEGERSQGRKIPRDCRWPQALLYSERVRYVEQLARYRAVIAPEQMLLLIYDDFRRDNEATVRQVLRFLDVDSNLRIDPQESNMTVRLRSKRVDEIIHATIVGRGPFSKGLKAVTSRRLRHSALRMRRHVVYGEPRPADESLTLELKRRFKGEVVALSEYLERDLITMWGYDDLD
ncbi:MAG: sulfotransferase family protein [Nitrososphaerales archaeon]